MLPFLEAPLKRTRKEAQDYLLIHPECTLIQEGCPKEREIQKRFKISSLAKKTFNDIESKNEFLPCPLMFINGKNGMI